MNVRALGLGVLCITLLAAAPWVGEPLRGELGTFVFWQLRVPRVLMGAAVGATLSLVGASYQTLFDNPLATPSTVGTTAGATLGTLAGLAVPLPYESFAVPWLTLTAFIGALATSSLVVFAARTGRARLDDLLLVGIAVTLAASALAMGLQAMLNEREVFVAVRWSLGQLAQVGYQGTVAVLPVSVIVIVSLMMLKRPLQVLVLGAEQAETRGVAVRRLRTVTLGLGALGVGVCVAWCGPIAFVGLIVPHLVRLSVGAELGLVMSLSILVGAAFVVFADSLARLFSMGAELPVGVVTAAIGAPTLLALVWRNRSS